MINNSAAMQRRVMVTGASGFVGQALCEALSSQGWAVRCAVRRANTADDVVVGDIGAETDWRGALEGIDAVVHLAARTHVMHRESGDVLDVYRSINVAGTARLATTAAARGVRRLVFLSSIKVNGESTSTRAFSESDAPQPEDAYGISKHEAEQALREVSAKSGLEVVIVRPPLVYGPGAKANFLRLLHLCARRTPLPLASINNRRSLIFLDNLVSAISACLVHPAAAGNTYLACDEEAVSTPELIQRISAALGVSPRTFHLQTRLVGATAALLGRSSEWARLANSLLVDTTKIRTELGWQPPFTMSQGLAATAQWYHKQFPLKSNT